MSYADSPACKMLATNCCCCGRPLVDATSCQLGIGPECRHGYDAGIPDEVRIKCNKLTYAAALAVQSGKVEELNNLAEQVRALGLATLADKMLNMFKAASKPANIKIKIRLDNNRLYVKTPFRRGDSQAFISAWRAIPGRMWNGAENSVPTEFATDVFELLKEFFPGIYGIGPKGRFRIPIKQPTTIAA